MAYGSSGAVLFMLEFCVFFLEFLFIVYASMAEEDLGARRRRALQLVDDDGPLDTDDQLHIIAALKEESEKSWRSFRVRSARYFITSRSSSSPLLLYHSRSLVDENRGDDGFNH